MSEPPTVLDKLRLVFELRKRQGWNPTYVEGETVLIISLLKAGESPENIARATLHKDWPGHVAKLAVPPDFLKSLGGQKKRTWWERLFSRPAR